MGVEGHGRAWQEAAWVIEKAVVGLSVELDTPLKNLNRLAELTGEAYRQMRTAFFKYIKVAMKKKDYANLPQELLNIKNRICGARDISLKTETDAWFRMKTDGFFKDNIKRVVEWDNEVATKLGITIMQITELEMLDDRYKLATNFLSAGREESGLSRLDEERIKWELEHQDPFPAEETAAIILKYTVVSQDGKISYR